MKLHKKQKKFKPVQMLPAVNPFKYVVMGGAPVWKAVEPIPRSKTVTATTTEPKKESTDTFWWNAATDLLTTGLGKLFS